MKKYLSLLISMALCISLVHADSPNAVKKIDKATTQNNIPQKKKPSEAEIAELRKEKRLKKEVMNDGYVSDEQNAKDMQSLFDEDEEEVVPETVTSEQKENTPLTYFQRAREALKKQGYRFKGPGSSTIKTPQGKTEDEGETITENTDSQPSQKPISPVGTPTENPQDKTEVESTPASTDSQPSQKPISPVETPTANLQDKTEVESTPASTDSQPSQKPISPVETPTETPQDKTEVESTPASTDSQPSQEPISSVKPTTENPQDKTEDAEDTKNGKSSSNIEASLTKSYFQRAREALKKQGYSFKGPGSSTIKTPQDKTEVESTPASTDSQPSQKPISSVETTTETPQDKTEVESTPASTDSQPSQKPISPVEITTANPQGKNENKGKPITENTDSQPSQKPISPVETPTANPQDKTENKGKPANPQGKNEKTELPTVTPDSQWKKRVQAAKKSLQEQGLSFEKAPATVNNVNATNRKMTRRERRRLNREVARRDRLLAEQLRHEEMNRKVMELHKDHRATDEEQLDFSTKNEYGTKDK